MTEMDNWIFEYNWEKDISEASAPTRVLRKMKPSYYGKDGIPWGMDHDDYILVQADPQDILQLEKGAAPEDTYNAHAWFWRSTLDTYLYEYFALTRQKAALVSSDEWEEIKLPDKIFNRLQKHRKAKAVGKAKDTIVNTDFIQFIPAGKGTKYDGDCYSILKIGSAFYLDQLCKTLTTSPAATTDLLMPRYDGTIYQDKTDKDFILEFKLEDYWEHESLTGISLTIEIASILLEVMKKYKNDALWEKAFDSFCQSALPRIVKSPYFFARNAVARYFFQQILMEQTIVSYQWNARFNCNWEDETYWDSLIERASFHINKLKMENILCGTSDEQIDTALAHVQRLLSAVKRPVDFDSYISHPTHGLALFCNTEHQYVSFFLERLNNQGKERLSQNPYSPINLFVKVRKAVKTALQNTDIPEDMIAHYWPCDRDSPSDIDVQIVYR